ncbi:hypothetical protein ANANG_G00193480, partial [Anguilla anguilla]
PHARLRWGPAHERGRGRTKEKKVRRTWRRRDHRSPREDVIDEGGVVDAAIGILLPRHQAVHLVLGHPLAERGQDMPELRPHDGAVALLVEDPEAFHEVLKISLVLGAGDVLEHGQEGLKVQHLDVHVLRARLAQDLQHVGVGGVLAQRAHHVTALGEGDLHLARWRAVEQRERLLELLNLVGGELHGDALWVKLGLLWGLWLRLGGFGGGRRLLLWFRLFGLWLLGFYFLGSHDVRIRI